MEALEKMSQEQTEMNQRWKALWRNPSFFEHRSHGGTWKEAQVTVFWSLHYRKLW